MNRHVTITLTPKDGEKIQAVARILKMVRDGDDFLASYNDLKVLEAIAFGRPYTLSGRNLTNGLEENKYVSVEHGED